MAAYHVDEGYSEYPMVQDDQETTLTMVDGSKASAATLLDLEQYLMGLNEDAKAEHVCKVLEGLRTSTISKIVDRFTPRFHLDPVAHLPPEIMAQILSYLDPEMLVTASTVSKAWRAETLETSLWRRKFVSEGWYLNISKVLKFEREHGRASVRKPLSRRAISDADSRDPKRRAVSPSRPVIETTPRSDLAINGSVSGASQTGELTSPVDTQSPTLERLNTACTTMSDEMHDMRIPTHSRALMIKMPGGDSRLDYQKLYRIKTQLEENWTQGRYKPFQFPHPDHQREAHVECVYTIQFSDKYLVSGSRDRTIRVWDLETCRLAKKPLVGHTGSVLSLQFDDSPNEDLIISGSSDKSIGIWQFSTGKLVRKISDMHNEAVLCVRFDKRYLASCSKDRLIKIFNRRPLKPGDTDYPVRGIKGGGVCPEYIIDMSYFNTVEDFERYLTPEQKQPLEPYSLIMTLDHHGGAVNSLHIHDDKLASGSGDRTAKIFNLRTGEILTNCSAHSKGVACIEYDGARLVTGSSDETIRIFDPATNAQVGMLDGHKKLVRTIQADFADAPGARETLEEDAMLADQALLDAQNEEANITSPRLEMLQEHQGQRPLSLLPPGSRRHRRATTPLHSAIGAKLPPGGGGNRWSRIVSGSYDETVIVWYRDKDGQWKTGPRYKVADVLNQAGPRLIAASDLEAIQRRNRPLVGRPSTAAVQPQQNQEVSAPSQQQQQHQGVVSSTSNAANAAAALAAATHHGTGSMPPAHLQHTGHSQVGGGIAPSVQAQFAGASTEQSHPQSAESHAASAGLHTQATIVNGPHQTLPMTTTTTTTAAAAAAAAALAMHQQIGTARAFKLQFDARRIICCSQDPKIVGWDFADGDPEIIEAAKFFTRTSHYARGG